MRARFWIRLFGERGIREIRRSGLEVTWPVMSNKYAPPCIIPPTHCRQTAQLHRLDRRFSDTDRAHRKFVDRGENRNNVYKHQIWTVAKSGVRRRLIDNKSAFPWWPAYQSFGRPAYLWVRIGRMSDRERVRNADPSEIAAIARVWYDAWQDAHANVLPAELARIRTLESFKFRLGELLDIVRVVGDLGRPLGFCIVKDGELYQLFVSAEARGTGVAFALLSDGEKRLADGGVKIAWLACAVGNDRAARFYEKSGWHNAGTVSHTIETPEGPVEFDVWRYEKVLF